MEEKSSVELINVEINRELSNEAAARALLVTTFKGLNAETMKQALMEGMMRGYTFKDFITKEVYATPFGSGYSIVESIGRTRKIGMRNGVIGKSAPTYAEDKDGKIISCSVTIYTKDGHPGGFTATVYFAEYAGSKPIWKEKPRTMIAKVAEMHALRMACPEELSQSYIEEEFDAEQRQNDRMGAAAAESRDLTMGAIKKADENKKTEETQDGKSAATGGDAQDAG